ncbi:MAG: hypothetical protein AABX07_05990 [Nanoarchaeota archaeon]
MKDKYKKENCMPLLMGKIAIALFLFLFLLPFARSAFYNGNVSVTDIRININISGEDVKINSDYTLMNLGNADESVLLTFPGYPADKIVSFNEAQLKDALLVKVRETKMVSVSANYKSAGSNKLLNYNPTIFINGEGIIKKINKIETHLIFASTNTKITNSEYDFTKIPAASGQHYLSSELNTYPTSSYIGWVESSAKLNVSRVISEVTGIGSNFTAVVKVKNLGGENVANIKLKDSLLARYFGSLQPAGDFVLVSGQMTDSSYSWEKSISSLTPGQEVVFQFSGKIESLEGIKFEPLRVLVGDALLMFYEGPEILVKLAPRDTLEKTSPIVKTNDSIIIPIIVKKDESPVISSPENLLNATSSQPLLNQDDYKELSKKITNEERAKTYSRYFYAFVILFLVVMVVIVIIYLAKIIKKEEKKDDLQSI